MVHINDHYLKLKAGYLFPEIARPGRCVLPLLTPRPT